MDFGLLLWTEDDSGLPTGPLTITKTLILKHFLDKILETAHNPDSSFPLWAWT